MIIFIIISKRLGKSRADLIFWKQLLLHMTVILSEAKDLLQPYKILRFAQDDTENELISFEHLSDFLNIIGLG